jgi:putative transposase
MPGNRVIIMGHEYKYFKSREIGGEIKTFTVKRDALGDFWLFFVTDEEIEPAEARSGESVGLDFGLKTFLTPLFMRQASGKIKKLSRKHSKKKRGSRNRHKARLNLARAHRKIANQRKDFHCKLALGACVAVCLHLCRRLEYEGYATHMGPEDIRPRPRAFSQNPGMADVQARFARRKDKQILSIEQNLFLMPACPAGTVFERPRLDMSKMRRGAR